MDIDPNTLRALGQMVDECVENGSAARIATANAIGAVYTFVKEADLEEIDMSEEEAREILEEYPYEF